MCVYSHDSKEFDATTGTYTLQTLHRPPAAAAGSATARVALNPAGSMVAVAWVAPAAPVVVLDLASGEQVWQCSSHSKSAQHVTCLLWSPSDGDILFTGDSGGLVAQSSGTTKLQSPTVLQAAAPIVQLDATTATTLLVSTLAATYVVSAGASKGGPVQVGTKARNGAYGACIAPRRTVRAFRRAVRSAGTTGEAGGLVAAKAFARGIVMAARPGRRLWVADAATGGVVSTLKVPPLITPSSVAQDCHGGASACASASASAAPTVTGKSPSFSIMYRLQLGGTPLLASHTAKTLCIIDPHPKRVHLCYWLASLGDVLDVAVALLHTLPPT